MNTKLLNIINLDDGKVIIKEGSEGGGGVTINNQNKYIELTENGTTLITPDSGFTGLAEVMIDVAIPNEEKTIEITENGTTEVTADNGFLSKVIVNTNVASSGGGSGWTGHADVEGLKAIGWTDEDIAYYQENGVNWNEEDDQYHLVTDDNKALYGVLTADNISEYKNRIVYLPKITIPQDTADITGMFSSCIALVAVPYLDTSNVTNMKSMFNSCYSLVTIPPLDTSNVTDMENMFMGCRSLVTIPPLDTSNVENMKYMFNGCYSLAYISPLNVSNVSNITNMFEYCVSLKNFPLSDTSRVNSLAVGAECNSLTYMVLDCTSNRYNITIRAWQSLTDAQISHLNKSITLSDSALISKESLLYIINTEAATAQITITLHSYAYDKWATDADVVAALSNHPNILLASA